MVSYRLISSAEMDLFQERLNRLSAALSTDEAVADIKFCTTLGHDGKVLYSALLTIKTVEAWQD